ncbi:MAG: restriction endonuclease subunit S [Burkholderiales bacterium]|nr:restriction endonuclease subunit S [Burkholderiales bacterium]
MKTKATKEQATNALVPKLRFPAFRGATGWEVQSGNRLFDQVSDKSPEPGLPVLAITQEHGAIPRDLIDYHVSVSEKSIESYKVVQVGDFIISLRSFQGGIEYSQYHGICSPAYVILRRSAAGSDAYFKHYLKTDRFIQILTKNLEGLRDGKMISYKQFSELQIPTPEPEEQQRIADCLGSLDELIAAQGRKVEALKTHKKWLMQQLFPREGETRPRLRFPEFQGANEWSVTTVGGLVGASWLFPPRDGNHGNIHPKSSDYVATGIPFIMASDLNGGLIDIEKCHFIRKEQADALQKGFAKEGDVLLSHKGTVGEVAVVRKINTPYLMLTPQVTYYRVKDHQKLSNEFLAQLFVADSFQANLVEASGGGTRAYIGITEQAKLHVQLPKNIQEQHRIADCLSSLDTLITAATQALDTLKTHKQGLMQQLFPTPEEVEA